MSAAAAALPAPRRPGFLARHLAFARANLLVLLAYRMNVFLWFFMELSRIVVLYFLWGAVFEHAPAEGLAGYTLPEMIGYVFIAVFVQSYATGDTVWLLSRKVTEGTIGADLVRPVDLQAVFFFADAGQKAVMLFFNAAALALAVWAVGIPHPTGWGIPVFLAALLLAGIINYFLDFLVGVVSFHVTNLWGIFIATEAVYEFFSGALIPLAFFPAPLRALADLLPFHCIVHAPVNLFLGKTPLSDAPAVLALQAFWAVALLVAGRAFFAVSLRRVTIHGG